jgi:hypothetical protein
MPMQWMKAGGVFDRIYRMNGIGQKTGQATGCQSPFSAIALAADSAEAATSPKTAVSIPSKTFTPSIPRPGGPPHFSPARQGRESVHSIGQAP